MLMELIKGVALLLALSLVQNYIIRGWRKNIVIRQALSGVLFGGICVIGMMTPIQLSSGVIFDARSVVLAMAGFFGGPIVGGIAGFIAGGYRLWLGGVGGGIGFGVIVSCVVLGLAYRHGHQKGWVTSGFVQFLIFGFIVHIVVVAWFLLFPPEIVDKIMNTVAVPFVITFTLATAFLGVLLQDIEKRLQIDEAFHRSHSELEARVAERTQALSKKTELLQATLSNMEGGLVVFDELGRILTWNERFFEIFDLPDRLRRTGLYYAEVAKFDLRHGLLDHGLDFDTYIQERMAGFAEGRTEDEEWRLTDGRIIEARRRPMPGGGQICTYHDVTIRKRAEDQMAEKEAQLRAVLDNISGGLRYVDRDRNYVFFNSQYCELYDFPDGLLKIGDSVRTENLYQAKRGDFGAGDADTLANTWFDELPVLVEPQSWERTTVHGKTLLVNTTPMPTGGIINIVTDITERKKLEEEMHQSRELFSRAFHANPNLIALVDPATGKHVDVNDAFLDTLKLSREDVIGKTSFEMNHWADFNDRDSILKEHSEHSRVRDSIGKLKAKDGTIIDCSFSTEPIKMDHLELVLWTVTDITERKRAEEVLQDALVWLEEAQRIGQVGHWVWDEIEDKQLFISKEHHRIVGNEENTKMRTWDEFLETVHPDDRERTNRVQKGATKTGASYESEYRIVLPNGETRYILEHGEPVFDDTGRLIKTVGTVQDITERKLNEKALRVAMLEAEQLNKAKSDFLATMSHELRTPLNAIIGFSAMIRDQMFGPKKDSIYAEYGADIFNSGHHLLRLINDLLDLSKIEAGKLELNFESLDVRQAVLESIHIIESMAARSNVEIQAELDENLPPLTADHRAFDQIVLNLLSNAIKFTPQGGRVTVLVSSNGKNTQLVIADTGIGIERDHINKVMKPWGQITNPMKSDIKGSGLGLPIVKSLVDLHGGKLSLTSEIGKGTTVTVTLPNEGP